MTPTLAMRATLSDWLSADRHWPKRISCRVRGDRRAAAGAVVAFLVVMGVSAVDEIAATTSPNVTSGHSSVVAASDVPPTDGSAGSTNRDDRARRTRALPGREWAAGGYGGVSYTHPSVVSIRNGERTDMTVRDFGWIGRPFKAPIYYGARIQRWNTGRTGTMVDFIHAKAIARDEDTATYTGQHNGTPLPETATIEDVFRKLEFSHGHNMLTLNGLLRLAPSWMRLRPYIGVGGGVSLPHTEVGFRADNTRTYEYQFTGFAGQALAGLEIQLGRASVFLEYKFTYAPYNVPLTQRSSKDFLVTDVWYQIRDWFAGKAPEGGRLDTVLATHHAVAGIVVKNGNWTAAAPR